MRSGEHWNDYPPDDPPQGPWCSRCERHAEDCQCPDPNEGKVWGGQLLGWTTQAEVDALDRSIQTDW